MEDRNNGLDVESQIQSRPCYLPAVPQLATSLNPLSFSLFICKVEGMKVRVAPTLLPRCKNWMYDKHLVS